MGEESLKLSKAELEELCLKQNIIIERQDPFNDTKIYLPNIEKINKMIREFDFLVDGESRGKAVNEISTIERFLFDNEENMIITVNLREDLIFIPLLSTSEP